MRKSILIFLIAMVFGLTPLAKADLYNRGNDILGNSLFYDDDLNITWYDFSYTSLGWDDAMDWAADLEVTLNGITYSNWRLPTTPGTATGFTSEGELGHLFYIEGVIWADPDPFTSIQHANYWTGTEYAPNPDPYAWAYSMMTGYQHPHSKSYYNSALAVLAGDVGNPVPEPSTWLLLSCGLVGLVKLGKKFRS